MSFIRHVVLLLLWTICDQIEGKTSFIKDLRTDVPFPPTNTRQSVHGLPEGHFRPLGWQRKPDGKVREEKDAIQPQTFHTRYIKNNRPAVFRGLIKQMHVIEAWEEDEYLKKQFGKINVTITVKRETTNTRTKRRMLFRKFLLDYMYENWYLASTINRDMLKELPLPSLLTCGTFKERLTEAELWMSSGGTSSLLHSHGDHNLHCVVDGRKDFIVIDPKHKNVFDFKENYPNSRGGYSPLDMNMINMFKYSKVAQTPWIWATLWQGDCLFLPAGHLHQVRSYGRGISYTIQFAPSRNFESSDCSKTTDESKGKRKKKDKKPKEEEIEEIKLSLADVDIMWMYSDGERRLSDEKLVPETMKKTLLLLIGDSNKLYKETFDHFYNEALHLDVEKPPTEEAFEILSPTEGGSYVSRSTLNKLETSRLQHLCDIFNRMNLRVHDEL